MTTKPLIPFHQESLIYNIFSKNNIGPTDFLLQFATKTPNNGQDEVISKDKLRQFYLSNQMNEMPTITKRVHLNKSRLRVQKCTPHHLRSTTQCTSDLNSKQQTNQSFGNHYKPKLQKIEETPHSPTINRKYNSPAFACYLKALPKKNLATSREMNLNQNFIRNSLLLPSLPEYLLKKSSQRYQNKNVEQQKQENSVDQAINNSSTNEENFFSTTTKRLMNVCEEIISNISTLIKFKNNSIRTAELIQKLLGFTPLINKLFLNKNQTSLKTNLSVDIIINQLASKIKFAKQDQESQSPPLIMKIIYNQKPLQIYQKDLKMLEYFSYHLEKFLEDQEIKKHQNDKINFINQYDMLLKAQNKYLVDFEINQEQLEDNMSFIKQKNGYLCVYKFNEIDSLDKNFGKNNHISSSTRRQTESIDELSNYYYQQII